MNWKMAWSIMLLWFGIIMVVLCIAGEWSVVYFGATYGLGFGGIAFRIRKKVRPFFKRIGLCNYGGFLLLTVIIMVTEETYCYLLGNQIAHPILWIDLVVVTVMWSVWFGSWYFFLARKYCFEEKEALMTAGFTGVFYEFVGTKAFMTNPFGILLAIPLAVVVYAALFILPLQLITFTGKNVGKAKYVVGAVLPFLLTLPAAVGLYLMLALFGVL